MDESVRCAQPRRILECRTLQEDSVRSSDEVCRFNALTKEAKVGAVVSVERHADQDLALPELPATGHHH